MTEQSFKHKTLEERAAEYGDHLNFDGEHDWGDPIGREKWSLPNNDIDSERGTADNI